MSQSGLSINTLLVNGLEYPMGIDDESVVFSWKLGSKVRGARQSAYQVLVSTDTASLHPGKAAVWDSGIREGRPLRVKYEGLPLSGHTRYWWKVILWDEQGLSWESAIVFFDTGLFSANWQATWIWKSGPLQKNDFAYFRKEMNIHKSIAMAKIFVSAHHFFQFYVNGQRVGGYGSPAPSNPWKRKYYLAYDVTGLLRTGENCLAAVVHYLGGDGQNYVNGLPGFIMQGEVIHTDGTTDRIVTDKSWGTLDNIPHQTGTPYQQNRRISAIESYDARRLDAGWTDVGFGETGCSKAVTSALIEAKPWTMKWQAIPEGEIEETIVPIPMKVQEIGRQVFDAGKIVSGWPRLTVAGIEGLTVRMRYSEDLDEYGYVKHNVSNEESEHYYDEYIMKGLEQESWQPDFSYKAFRYVEVTGYPELLSSSQILIISAHTGLNYEGGFHSSNGLLNDLYEACIQTQKNNVLGQLVDCPHREQAQYLADSDLQAETLLYHFDAMHILEKVLSDFVDGQQSNGLFPFVFPSNYQHPDFDIRIPEWDLHFCTLLWKTYLMTGDRGLLERYYMPARQMIMYYLKHSDVKLGLIPKSIDSKDWHISDHPYTNIDQEGSFLTVQNIKIAHVLTIMSEISTTLNYEADAEYMILRAQLLHKAILTYLYDAPNKRYRDCYLSEESHQGTNVLALQYGLVPLEDKSALLAFIVSQGLSCRTLLSLNLLQLLFEHGEEEAAFRLLSKTDHPGWGYMIEQSARTIWEGFDDIESHCHAWNAYPARLIVEYLVGIQSQSAGWDQIRIKPYMPAEIGFMEGRIMTPRGKVSVKWEKRPDVLILNVEIPVNTTARVLIPVQDALDFEVRESGNIIWANGTFHLSDSQILNGEAVLNGISFEIQSGSYSFHCQTPTYV